MLCHHSVAHRVSNGKLNKGEELDGQDKGQLWSQSGSESSTVCHSQYKLGESLVISHHCCSLSVS